MVDALTCEDCGGKGVDPGSLDEPESCPSCLGSGKQVIEFDRRSSHFLKRRPMGRALPNPVTVVELEERRGRYGD